MTYQRITTPQAYDMITVHMSETVDVAMHLKHNGRFLEQFYRLDRMLSEQSHRVLFAANAGIFMENLVPLGLYIEQGQQLRPLNTKKHAYGNFYLQPNGVFFITHYQQLGLLPTSVYQKQAISPAYATQSGPMLVIDGEINSLFAKDSKHYNIRSAVGLLDEKTAVFVLSRQPVTFYQLATLLQTYGVNNALYLDGRISQFYSRQFVQINPWFQHSFGPFIVVTQKQK